MSVNRLALWVQALEERLSRRHLGGLATGALAALALALDADGRK